MLFFRYKNEARLDSILHRPQPTEFQTFIKNRDSYHYGPAKPTFLPKCFRTFQ